MRLRLAIGLDSMVYNVEKMLKESPAIRLPEGDKS